MIQDQRRSCFFFFFLEQSRDPIDFYRLYRPSCLSLYICYFIYFIRCTDLLDLSSRRIGLSAT